MKKMMFTARHFFAVLVFTLMSTLAFGQGATTSEMNGRVLTDGGESLPGATVFIVHTPTGTQTGTTADSKGYFRLPNLHVGGPYEVTISFIGYKPFSKNDVYLSLGQAYKINARLQDENQKIDEVVVTASMVGEYQVFDGNRTGSETVVSRKDIDELPSVSGNLNDFLRLTPQASANGEGMTLAGMNNRYNSLMIDGTVNNDVFGLSANGMNGGQSGVSPISIEAIEQIQVVLAPFDVRQGGFAGGGINAVTKSGTNQFKGVVYHKYRNEKLAGKTPTYRLGDKERKRLDEFTAKTTGFSVGGPIIKNKLFFFVNGEKRKDETPQPFAIGDYTGASNAAQIKQVQDQFRSYGYEPGGYENNVKSLEGEKLLVKLNWNINANHRLMLRHQYTKGENFSPSRSNPKTISFYNSGQFFPSTTNATAIELKSRFGHNFSNSLKIGYTSVHDDRDPLGGNFPAITIRDGAGTMYAGSETYSTGNELKQKILTVTDNFQIYKGAHTITLGTHNEFYDIYNLFMRQAYGSYVFNSVADFASESPSESRLGFSLIDDVRGDGSAAAADFNFYQLGFYAQDEWQVSDNLKVTGGLRIDIPVFNDDPMAVADFNSTTVPELENYYDLKGARAGKMPSTQVMWSPRVGFNWDVKGLHKTQVRGGVGVFTSRIPFVWPAGSYTNNGMMQGDYRLQTKYGDAITFVPEWDKQPKPSGASAPTGSQIDIYGKDFKFPQVLRANLGVDQQLPWGVVGTFEVMYTKILNNALWKDVNIKPAFGSATGTPDNRPLYKTYKNGIDPQYGQIMLGDNTSKGYTYNLTAQFRKDFNFGLGASIAYNYGQAKSIFDGTSSQNSSQWNYLVSSPTPRNEAELGYSGFDQGHRVVGSLTYSKEYLKHLKTSVGLFYNGQSGRRFSYIYNDYSGSFTNEAYKGPELIYVPENSNGIVLGAYDSGAHEVVAYDRNSTEFQKMWAELNEYIEQDDYLRERRGKYAERNGSRLPWQNIFDLKLTQDLFMNVADRKQTLQLGIDIFNVGNMINKDWGRMYYASNDNISLIKFEGMAADKTTPIMSFSRPEDDKPWFSDDSGLNSSRWQAQVTLRYIF
ncbi:TonB-dependent receptor [Labilibaculum euxinus]|uniref:TonB-dependent receptor plug domain-containing protein n=1 Tax=Labilibaculum euxinus TaxID=2686357 RepID=A0A7M4D4X8_9BACT|nr:TonB-dependent receptor [Labilibaculum euxinus]MUP37707.1 TonB-dependent receptor plug domain-containing protein [Labilibaculum euxinus]MVB06912.1 TonB-dependent receptor plug domain-containing protein [Labilibaculum euxinus]